MGPRADEVVEYLHVDIRTVRDRITALTAAEKDHLECRLAAQDGAT